MAVKYECPECGRRFLEWGAEKVGFKCPNDEHRPDGHPDDVELTPITFEQDQPIRRKPTLKRSAAAAKRRTAASKVSTEDDILDTDNSSEIASDADAITLDDDALSSGDDDDLPAANEDG